MTGHKPRTPRSFEHATELAIETLGAGRCAAAVGRSERLVYAWSDDHAEALPNARQMLALDRACRAKDGSTPFADAYAEALDYTPAPQADPDVCVRRLLGSIGRVCDHHEEALADDGRYDAAERREQVQHLYEARDRLDRCIDAIGPTDGEAAGVEDIERHRRAG